MRQGEASSFSHSELHPPSPVDLTTTAGHLGTYSSSNRPLTFSYSGTISLISTSVQYLRQQELIHSEASLRKLTKARHIQSCLGELQHTD